MNYESLRGRVLDQPILASDGSHSARLWRVAENVRDHVDRNPSDDRVHHLMSRVGVFCGGLAKDLRSGHTSVEQAATLLSQMAQIGDLSFKEWLQRE